jgi:hypothetical protein
MKRAGISLLITVFFLFLFSYVLNNVSPWQMDMVQKAIQRYSLKTTDDFNDFIKQSVNLGLIWNLLNIKNLVIFLSALGGVVVSAFATLHMFLEKLFVSKFYEKPDYGVAVRRGIIVYLVLAALIALNFMGGFLWYNALAIIFLGAALEYLFINLKKRELKHNAPEAKS